MSFSSQLITGPLAADYRRLLGLLSIPGVTDLMANGANDWWLDSGSGLQLLGSVGIGEPGLLVLSRYLIELGERHIDQASPIADVAISCQQLPQLESLGISGIRVHAVLESAVSDRILLSIRVHRNQSLGLQDLVASGMVGTEQVPVLLEMLTKRSNFLIIGPAAAGKTTLMRSLLAESASLRTVIIEDTAELMPVAGHCIGLQVRQPNIEGVGWISLQALAIQALRMRPDRIVIGEVRGPEVLELLSAMNTGHRGSAATLHANAAAQLFTRVRAMAGTGVTDSSLRAMLETAVDCVIQLGFHSGQRRVIQIGGLKL
jgi:pilus assembly protein CpaF